MARTLTNFNGGLFTPYLKGRIELEKYATALQDIENYTLMRYGALQNRAGTVMLENVDASDIRLIPFQYNIEQSYILAFFNNRMLVIKDDDFIGSVDVPTPYSNSQLSEIQYKQISDKIYLVHPDVAPQIITRHSDVQWTIERNEKMIESVFLEYNNSQTTLTPSGTHGDIAITSSTNLFETGHFGRVIQIKQPHANNSTTGTTPLAVYGAWNFSTKGQWNGTTYLDRSSDNGLTWAVYRRYTSSSTTNDGVTSGGTNYQIDGKETEENILYRIRPASGCSAELISNEMFTYGTARITSVVSAVKVNAHVLIPFDGTNASLNWAFNSFSDMTGFPRAIELFQDRMIVGGTYAQPSTVFFSKLTEWGNFNMMSGAVAPVTVKLNTSETIQWFSRERDGLTVGTTGDEWKVGEKSAEKGIAIDNIKVTLQGSQGSSYIQAINIKEVLIFVARDEKHIRAMNYDFESDKLKSNDLCSLSGVEHLESGVKAFCYKQNPNSEAFFILNNGKLAVLTYDMEQNIYAWTVFGTKGEIKSACSLKHKDKDNLYIAVERTLNGVTRLFIEKQVDRSFDSREDYHFSDCGYQNRFSSPTSTIDGVIHLANEEVECCIDGRYFGKITLSATGGYDFGSYEFVTISLGLTYKCYAQIMDIDSTDGRDSNLPARKKHNKIYVKIKDSIGLWVGENLDNLWEQRFHGSAGNWFDIIEPITDVVAVNIDSRHNSEYAPYFAQLIPQPQEILAYASAVSIGS